MHVSVSMHPRCELRTRLAVPRHVKEPPQGLQGLYELLVRGGGVVNTIARLVLFLERCNRLLHLHMHTTLYTVGSQC